LARQTKGKKPAWGKLALYCAALLALALVWRFTPLADLLTRENAAAWSRYARGTPWAPLAIILSFTPAALILFPRPFLTLLAVITFGRWLGAAYSAAGIMLAAMATYYLGRVLRRDTVLRLAGGGLEEAGKLLREHGIIAVFGSNQLPVPPFAVQGIIAGALRMPAWQYAVGSLLGMAPGLLAATLFAGELHAWIEDPTTLSWWVLGAVLAVFAAFIWLARRWYARRIGR
jgi:uncharacterized membrane protein YdjX (TVP38/TMEM64 family)